jgi:DNA-binding NarL/FixJ family response regulator
MLAGYWCIDEYDRMLELSGEVASAGRRSGSLVAALGHEMYPGIVEVRRGGLTGAEARMRAVAGVATQSGMSMWILSTVHVFVDVVLERPGNQDLTQLLETLELEDAFLDSLSGATLLEPRGRLRHQRGDREGGIADLRRAVDTYRALQLGPTFTRSRSSLALALPAASRDEALELCVEELALARGTELPRPEAVALTALGLVEGGDDGIDMLREALALLDGSEWRLERARTLVELGAALRRAKLRTEARTHLTAGLDLAQRCGAVRLAQRAEEELRAAGARPRRTERSGAAALTASELRVAELAAQGRTNVEIAQDLFVSAKTVETHLSNSYRKLGLAGQGARGHLAEALDG